jgi:hypothetical protein
MSLIIAVLLLVVAAGAGGGYAIYTHQHHASSGRPNPNPRTGSLKGSGNTGQTSDQKEAYQQAYDGQHQLWVASGYGSDGSSRSEMVTACKDVPATAAAAHTQIYAGAPTPFTGKVLDAWNQGCEDGVR